MFASWLSVVLCWTWHRDQGENIIRATDSMPQLLPIILTQTDSYTDISDSRKALIGPLSAERCYILITAHIPMVASFSLQYKLQQSEGKVWKGSWAWVLLPSSSLQLMLPIRGTHLTLEQWMLTGSKTSLTETWNLFLITAYGNRCLDYHL